MTKRDEVRTGRSSGRRRTCAAALAFGAALLLVPGAAAQQKTAFPKARPADVRSVNAIVRATYESISNTATRGREMRRFESLFKPDAQLIDVTYREGKPTVVIRTIEQFVQLVDKLPNKPRRYEHEVTRRTERYGNLVQVWSTNVYGMVGQRKPAGYGINSITLAWDGARWWIIAVSWKNETPGQMVPKRYFPHGKEPAGR